RSGGCFHHPKVRRYRTRPGYFQAISGADGRLNRREQPDWGRLDFLAFLAAAMPCATAIESGFPGQFDTHKVNNRLYLRIGLDAWVAPFLCDTLARLART